MERRNRTRLIGGALMVLIGLWVLLVQIFPDLRLWPGFEFSWPLIIVGVGFLLLIIGLVTGEPDMAVPAVIVAGIGGILYWQNSTDNWASWAYIWALIPGFVGLGIILAGLLSGDFRRALREGLNLIIISAVLFTIFASFFGGLNILGPYWPILLILLGIWLLVQALWRKN
jgi:hypothetical protein